MSDAFEVLNIIDDKVVDEQSYFLVVWKDTISDEMAPLLRTYKKYKDDVHEFGKKNQTYTITWKNTWMSFEQLKDDADETLAIYLLLKLKKYNQ